jgi:heme exporter protein A
MSVAHATAEGTARVTLEARELAHDYGRRVGLRPVSFRLDSAGVVAITGANGSGKSTLVRIIAGLLRPSHGSLSFTAAGRPVERADRRRCVGYASPELEFYDELSVTENLEFAAEARGDSAARESAAAALARVGLESRASDRVTALSSGMRQRLRVAFALLHRPPMLLLDEPGSHMDDDGRARLAELILHEGRSALVLIATNDEREWRLAGQRIELQGRGLGHPA